MSVNQRKQRNVRRVANVYRANCINFYNRKFNIRTGLKENINNEVTVLTGYIPSFYASPCNIFNIVLVLHFKEFCSLVLLLHYTFKPFYRQKIKKLTYEEMVLLDLQ